MFSMNTIVMENNSRFHHNIVMTNGNNQILRHGDLLLKTVKDIPEKAVKIGTDTLQEGEVTDIDTD